MQSDSDELTSMQTRWATQLNPLLANLFLQGRLIKGVVLATGSNTINHGLGRKLQGWVLTDIQAPANISSNQTSNPFPALTLILIADTGATVDLYVF